MLSAPIIQHLRDALNKADTDVAGELFGSNAVVRFILAALPAEAQMLVMRMAMLPDSTRWDPLLLWFKGSSTKRTMTLKSAINACRRFKVLRIQSINGSQQSGQPNIHKYEIHPKFLQTMRRRTAEARGTTLIHSSYKWLRAPSQEDMKSFSCPDALSIESFSRQKWGGMLLWAFKQSATQSPVLRFFPITQVTPPAEVLRNVLISRGLVNGDTGQSGTRKTDEIRWFLSDLTTQVDQVIMRGIEHLASGDHIPLLAVLSHICSNKIGEPLLVSNSAPAEVRHFLTLTHAMGFAYTAPNTLFGHQFTTVFTCPLARVLVLDAESGNNAELWILSQLFGTDSIKRPSTVSCRHLPLPKQRYSISALPPNGDYMDPPLEKNFEFLWSIPSDPLSHADTNKYSIQEQGEKQKGIIVESNFRVFCYHPDALQASVIASICEVKMITPILIVAMLTRDSVVKRLLQGLTAQQIIKFLASHAHSLVTNKLMTSQESNRQHSTKFAQSYSAVPENVLNQLLLWEDQLSAISCTKAALFELTDPMELAIFPQLIFRARSAGALISHTPCPLNNKSSEFNIWKDETTKRLKSAAQAPSFQLKFGEEQNWYPWAPIIVINSEYKDEFIKTVKNLRASGNVQKRLVG